MKILKPRAIGILLASALMLIAACDRNIPTSPDNSGKWIRAAAGKTDSTAKVSGATNGATTAAVSTISLFRGDQITVTVQSAECSGNPETANMLGVLSGLVASGACDGGLVGESSAFGPAGADGTISFTATHQEFGTGALGSVSGVYPDYTVGLNDGYGDTDFNDVVLFVHVIRNYGQLACTPQIPTRGQTVTCTVTGAGVAVTKWTFVGQAFDDPTTFWRVNGPTSGNSWKGPAIVGGTVTAESAVNGVPQTNPLTASFSVQGRTGHSWSWGPGNHWQYTRGAVGAQPNCFTGVEGEPLLYSENKLFGWSNPPTSGITKDTDRPTRMVIRRSSSAAHSLERTNCTGTKRASMGLTKRQPANRYLVRPRPS